MVMRLRIAALAVLLAIAGCGDAGEPQPVTPSSPPALAAPASGCADVVGVTAEVQPDGTYRFDVTVRSSDTGDEKYADAWEVRSSDGSVLATRVLTHPHVGEQPFTRSLSGVAIPPGSEQVVVAARDSVAGYCGAEHVLTLPG